jgi:N-acetyl-gamma-glutamylphosphate reductase
MSQGTTSRCCRSTNACAAATTLRVPTLPAAERKDARRRAEAINSADIALLCLPDAAPREGHHPHRESQVRLPIDASSAHRTSPGWVYASPNCRQNSRRRSPEHNA